MAFARKGLAFVLRAPPWLAVVAGLPPGASRFRKGTVAVFRPAWVSPPTMDSGPSRSSSVAAVEEQGRRRQERSVPASPCAPGEDVDSSV